MLAATAARCDLGALGRASAISSRVTPITSVTSDSGVARCVAPHQFIAPGALSVSTRTSGNRLPCPSGGAMRCVSPTCPPFRHFCDTNG